MLFKSMTKQSIARDHYLKNEIEIFDKIFKKQKKTYRLNYFDEFKRNHVIKVGYLFYFKVQFWKLLATYKLIEMGRERLSYLK